MLSRERSALWMPMGLGKALHFETPVLTTKGWLPIGFVAVGDAVVSDDGEPYSVTGVFPQGVRDMFRVTFVDGSWVDCDADHLWTVTSPDDRHEGRKPRTVTTQALLKSGLRVSGGRKWAVPLAQPVKLPEAELPVEPYLLGVILGDGGISGDAVNVTTDAEILDSLEIPPGVRIRGEQQRNCVCGHIVREAASGPNPLKGLLSELGLMGKLSIAKFVPPQYLSASPGQRLALLQGLLDTDGYAGATGYVEFSSSSKLLAEDVAYLARSLGALVTARKPKLPEYRHNGEYRTGQLSYRLHIRPPAGAKFFRLTRKRDAQISYTKYPPLRLIDSIEPAPAAEAVCISVSAPSKLFVCKDFIVTHNTVSSLEAIAARHALDGEHKTLVLGPKRVIRDVWPFEVKKWDSLQHLDVTAIDGDAATRRRLLHSPAPIHAIGYDNVPWLLEQLGGAWPYDAVVADESSKLKAHDSVRFDGVPRREKIFDTELQLTTALANARHPSYRPKTRDGRFEMVTEARRGLRHILAKTRYWTNLTGTPAPNGLEDLWAQTYLLDQGARLGGNITSFRNRWFRPKQNGFGVEPLGHAHGEITALLSDICLPMRVSDYFDLPPLIENLINVPLPARAKELQKQMKKDLLIELRSGTVTAANAADKTNKLLQLASGAVYLNREKDWEEVHTAKLEALDSVMEEAAGEPVIVTYHFKPDLGRLLATFPDARQLKTKKDEEDWNAGRIPMLLLHPASAGHGLNLQYGGHILADFTINWNLENDQQVIERIGPTRQMQAGLTRPTIRHRLMAEGSIDHYVLSVLQGKATTQDALMEFAQS
jgi:hypothetical protein